MWTGSCSLAVHANGGYHCENWLCFSKLPTTIPSASVLEIGISGLDSSLDPKGYSGEMKIICRAYESKSMLSQEPTYKTPAGQKNTYLYVTKAIMKCISDRLNLTHVKVIVNTVIPKYQMTPATYITVTPQDTFFRSHTISPSLLRHRLLQRLVSSDTGISIYSDPFEEDIQCSVNIFPCTVPGSEHTESTFTRYQLVTRRTQIIMADKTMRIPVKTTLAFDVQDQAVCLPILSQFQEWWKSACENGHSTEKRFHRSPKLLIGGDPGSGKVSFIYGLIQKIQSQSLQLEPIQCIEVNAAEVTAEGKEFSDAALNFRLSKILVQSRIHPVVLILKKVEVFAPRSTSQISHSLSKTEAGLISVRRIFLCKCIYVKVYSAGVVQFSSLC